MNENSIIKSLYPHPDLATPFGFKSRDMNSPLVNWKSGGKIK